MQRVCARAYSQWKLDITESPGEYGFDKIDKFIRSGSALAWAWKNRYIRNGQFQWCGASAADAYGAAGLPKHLRVKFFSSTFRLWCMAQYKIATATAKDLPGVAALHRAAGMSRMLQQLAPGDMPRFGIIPGDILLVGYRNPERPWSNHVALAFNWNGGAEVDTLEGNAKGPGPNGNRREGVILHKRSLAASKANDRGYFVRAVVRLSLLDFDMK